MAESHNGSHECTGFLLRSQRHRGVPTEGSRPQARRASRRPDDVALNIQSRAPRHDPACPPASGRSGLRRLRLRSTLPCVRHGRRIAARIRSKVGSSRVLIAATAIAHNFPLFTCNPADFGGIPQLDVRPVPHPDRRNGDPTRLVPASTPTPGSWESPHGSTELPVRPSETDADPGAASMRYGSIHGEPRRFSAAVIPPSRGTRTSRRKSESLATREQPVTPGGEATAALPVGGALDITRGRELRRVSRRMPTWPKFKQPVPDGGPRGQPSPPPRRSTRRQARRSHRCCRQSASTGPDPRDLTPSPPGHGHWHGRIRRCWGRSANKIPGGMPRHRPHRADLDTAVRLATAKSQSGRTSCVIAMVSATQDRWRPP